MIKINYLNELSGQQVYEFLGLRQSVFLLEQNCVYPDIDGLDASALHVRYLGKNGLLSGYARILPPTDEHKLSIGRVVVSKNVRNRGIGREIMEIAIKESQTHYPREEIEIHAQTYLIDFYTSFGFQKFGSEFLEAGIPHQGMSMLPEQPAY